MKFLPFDNVGILMSMATDYYKAGRMELRAAKIKE
jgi:hypothetical protein